ncbi:hypothetical protein HZH68_008058 [Vespula germanica]|uniref:Uncharacterized protein n=1 Tax=Vespula germanica TaxID=30212 RepID=A0A834K8T9_VESGE|nr:hypothetical protein HZH68_008058 [Vespula germanica]
MFGRRQSQERTLERQLVNRRAQEGSQLAFVQRLQIIDGNTFLGFEVKDNEDEEEEEKEEEEDEEEEEEEEEEE